MRTSLTTNFFLFLLLIIFSTAGAITPDGRDTQNVLGLYGDEEATINHIDGMAPFSQADIYLVVTNPFNEARGTAVTFMGGVEFAVLPTNALVLSITWPVDVTDVGTGDNHIVGFGTPVPVMDGMATLCTINFLYQSAISDPGNIWLAPTVPPSIDGFMAVLDSGWLGDIVALTPSSGDFSSPVFGINTGPLWGDPTPPGDVVIDTEPDHINAPWTLVGLGGFQQSGNGDLTIQDLAPDTYVLTWEGVNGYLLPPDNPQVQILESDGEITFYGEYALPGDVHVTPEPSTLSATWTLQGPYGFFEAGQGIQSYSGVTPGPYILTWGDVPGWVTPSLNPVVLTLDPGGAITFQAEYIPYGEIVINPSPDSLNAPWTIEGPDGFSQTGNGDHALSVLATGQYILTWGEITGWGSPIINPQIQELEYQETIIFDGEYLPGPFLTSVTDVPNDQGRQVRLVWDRCGYDAPGFTPTITEYGIYRRQDDKNSNSRDKLADWDFVGLVPARGDDVYQFVAPTLCDSTVSGGDCPSTFIVSAMTESPFEFFDSEPMSGYSVDNLQPVQPAGFYVAFAFDGNVLTWDAPTDPDVDHYVVYRSTNPEFPGGDPLAEVVGTTWTDELDRSSAFDFYYWIVAVDHSGNHSDPTEWDTTQISDVEDIPLPTKVNLFAAAPNPFNPMTTIAFDLPKEQQVRLSIYSIDGRLVYTLVNEVRSAGSHQVIWSGQDSNGRTVSSGTYVYRLESGSIRMQRTMTLIK